MRLFADIDAPRHIFIFAFDIDDVFFLPPPDDISSFIDACRGRRSIFSFSLSLLFSPLMPTFSSPMIFSFAMMPEYAFEILYTLSSIVDDAMILARYLRHFLSHHDEATQSHFFRYTSASIFRLSVVFMISSYFHFVISSEHFFITLFHYTPEQWWEHYISLSLIFYTRRHMIATFKSEDIFHLSILPFKKETRSRDILFSWWDIWHTYTIQWLTPHIWDRRYWDEDFFLCFI